MLRERMSWVLVLIFAAVAAAALAFVCWPLWHAAPRGRVLLVGSVASLMLAITAGTYIFVGHPELALRSFEPPTDTDLRALVSRLAWQVRKKPDDARGWALLGRGYLSLEDPTDAAGAFKRAVELAPLAARPSLLSAYGEALTMAAAGAVTPEAEAAFRQALALDPKDFAARFYLGQLYADRHEVKEALGLWEGLLADTPPTASWREPLLARIAMLKAASGNAPDVGAMVQGLADRLKAHPADPIGWQRLVKAYVVLGKADKARAALADARKAMVGNRIELAALDAEARDLKLAP